MATPRLKRLSICRCRFLGSQVGKALAEVRKTGTLPYLRPDGKTQVSVAYDENMRPIEVETVVVSAQHHPDVDQSQLNDDIIEHVIRPVIPEELLAMLGS